MEMSRSKLDDITTERNLDICQTVSREFNMDLSVYQGLLFLGLYNRSICNIFVYQHVT